jgi:DNA-directed RNA polymerase III subunit RPC4
MNVDTPSKKVTFAPDSKPPAESSTPPTPAPESQQKSIEEPEPKVDGIIGNLEVHRSGAVKMCLGNSILMDVSTILNPLDMRRADIQPGHGCDPAFFSTTRRLS